MASAERLPEIRSPSSAVRMPMESTVDSAADREREIDELKKEVERLRRENRVQADQLTRAASSTPPRFALDDSTFVPRSPLATTQKMTPAPPAASSPSSGRPVHLSGTRKIGAKQEVNEHPLKQEYREIQDGASRWVTTDQPFMKGPGGKGINMCDNVSEDFFRTLINQATFNLPRELRYALAMGRESLDKMQESLDVLALSQKTVDKTATDTLVDVKHDFELSTDRLRNKELYFHNEVCQHREEMAHKIDTELSIVGMLVKTLEDSIGQANSVLERNMDPKHADHEANFEGGGKSLTEIRSEYNGWRKQIFPTYYKVVGEALQARAGEMLNSEKSISIHDIIASLLTTLEAALAKGKHTEERLLKHKVDVELMCEQTIKEFEGDFVHFREALKKKEEEVLAELHTFKEDTTAKITANTLTVNNYQAVLEDHVTYGTRVLEKGNDYQMFKQTKEMKNQMVMMYAELAKMRLQYDGIMFQLASNDFDVPIEHIGSLMNASTKAPVDWSPKANKQRSKKMFLSNEQISAEEAGLLRQAFKEYDKDGNGQVEADELISLWKSVWPWATENEVRSVVHRFMQSVDKNNDGTVDFEEFMGIIQMKSQSPTTGMAFRPI
mmetsp:Transcript_132449/g.229755  ORF Transcript_132449/g.229755 Transcript_132449/m.229755 type:complete len:613 (-) Transcript_132449:1356-3194(-)